MSRPAAAMAIRIKPLPRGHRMAHLRALLRQGRAGSVRGEQLAALLSHETVADVPGGVQSAAQNNHPSPSAPSLRLMSPEE